MREGFARRLDAALKSVRARFQGRVKVAVVLGSGLGEYAERLEGTRIEYSSIAGFPVPSVQGHRGVLSLKDGIALFAGRFHYYEGLEPARPGLVAARGRLRLFRR